MNSISSSSLPTVNISDQDFPVFTTDSQSIWLPNSDSHLPAPSEHQSPNLDSPQQDFVLFDSPQPRQLPNRTEQLNSQRRHSYHNRRDKPSSFAIQNQRVAQILQAIGHQSPSRPTGNRFPNQFYASSAPSSTVSLNQHSRSSRPPVPLFNQNTGSGAPSGTMMNAAGLLRPHNSKKSIRSHSSLDVDLDDFTVFDGGASTAFSSPAVPSAFDFSSASSVASHMGTVSPQDLLIHEPFMSAPNSTALTALTSPSVYNESPDLDGYNVSPNFDTGDFEAPNNDPWYPLFPSESNSLEQANNEQSPAQGSDDIDSVDRSSGSTTGKKRSSGSPTGSIRHSSVSGVASRKRDKPLPPIIVEDAGDVVSMKRARNTLAARKSRERKAMRLEELEERIEKLEAERDHWKKIALAQSGMRGL